MERKLKMSDAEAREIFNSASTRTDDADTRSLRELCREYFTNPDFKKKFHDFMWQQSQENGVSGK